MTSLDFAGTPKPDGKLRSAVLIQGTGATVKKGQTITVNYLGQVYKGKKPFDESYSKQPASFAIGTGEVISGWDKTLVGQKVGSRVDPRDPAQGGLRQEGPARPQASRAPTRCTSWSTSSAPPEHHGGHVVTESR